jgi:hypothetical protein
MEYVEKGEENPESETDNSTEWKLDDSIRFCHEIRIVELSDVVLKGFGRKQAMILNQIKCLEGGHPTREG